MPSRWPSDAVRGRPTTVAGLLVVLLVVLLLWWADGGAGPDAEPRVGERGGAGGVASDAPGDAGGDGVDGLPTVRLADLPPQAADTVALIDRGGPFPYPGRDDETFGNFEGLLPERPRGHYREYTVPTPGSDDRGARRIVAGAGGELYWTADHYASFERIVR